MEQFTMIATTTFGIEAICKRELIALGYKVIKTENGKVTFLSDVEGIVRANLWLRTADRVLIQVGEFSAVTFDELFDQTKALPWGEIIPENGKFVVNGKSIKSKLFSISDSQRIVKKAIVESLKETYSVDWLEETGADYTCQVSLLKDIATITIDTSGGALHKRGYRVKSVTAPLKETLAASLILLSFWNKDRVLYDLFCGSGTIPIEAAMIGRNIAPGLNRDFASKHWDIIPNEVWKEETRKAYQAIDHDAEIKIFASDIDENNLRCAEENAQEAGVEDCITFKVSDFKDMWLENDYSIIISNPPYGERLEDEAGVRKIYHNLSYKFKNMDTWSKYFITSYKEFEKAFHEEADRKRKLYNGRIETWYYQYYGPRPKRETIE
ncbi:Ribosomal RNA large subunit methyltransferase L [Candidatus Izimaplasma bacterium HR1]|uniref:THUMP domain-containing class I SAM-dependent RNA methyltransferase n=1 Tax=Candidatus Izimoplasma sp. HR1 TaxID=1541959 RepID=UPI0004F7C9DC|nr:Ribosomal RNA large subunit methyltransferase L [Candidatus Izimaplasma bacterium HR1]